MGPLTRLVNNASVFEPDEIETTGEETWSRHFEVNLRAPVFLARDFAHQVPVGREGAVVNIIDQRVLSPNPLFFSYTLSKAALFTATKTMAQALAPRIRVNAVGPGPTLPSSRQSADDIARQSVAVPLGGGPSPEDIAEAVLFLANARKVTGQMLAAMVASISRGRRQTSLPRRNRRLPDTRPARRTTTSPASASFPSVARLVAGLESVRPR